MRTTATLPALAATRAAPFSPEPLRSGALEHQQLTATAAQATARLGSLARQMRDLLPGIRKISKTGHDILLRQLDLFDLTLLQTPLEEKTREEAEHLIDLLGEHMLGKAVLSDTELREPGALTQVEQHSTDGIARRAARQLRHLGSARHPVDTVIQFKTLVDAAARFKSQASTETLLQSLDRGILRAEHHPWWRPTIILSAQRQLS